MITATDIKNIVRLIPFNPKNDKFWKVVSGLGVEYWEKEIIRTVEMLSYNANEVPEALDARDYREQLLRVARLCVLCIDDADKKIKESGGPVDGGPTDPAKGIPFNTGISGLGYESLPASIGVKS